MSDNSGGFFGGAATGLGEAQAQALAQQKQDAIEANQAKTDAAKQIDATIQHIKEVSEAAAKEGKDPRVVLSAVQPLISSAQQLAEVAGIDPAIVTSRASAVTMAPPAQGEPVAPVAVKPGDSLVHPTTGKVVYQAPPLHPETGAPMTVPGQPTLGPSDVIPPAQAAAANPPSVAPVEDASLPPGAAPTQGPSPFDSRFAEPPAPQVLNHNVNYDVLEKYPPKVQALIKGLSDGTIDPSKAFSKRIGKEGESELTKFLGIVKEYDPSFDTANAPARAATLKAFKSGVEARKLSALGTVVGHVTELAKDGVALDNWKSETFGPLTQSANKMRLWMQENKQSPIVTRFDNAATAVANELENAFRGNNTAISGIMEWRKGINAGMASDQISESTKVLGKLLLARMGELKEQWDRGMGHNQDPTIAIKLVKTRELLEKMSAGTLLTDRAANAPPPEKVQSLKDKYKLD